MSEWAHWGDPGTLGPELHLCLLPLERRGEGRLPCTWYEEEFGDVPPLRFQDLGVGGRAGEDFRGRSRGAQHMRTAALATSWAVLLALRWPAWGSASWAADVGAARSLECAASCPGQPGFKQDPLLPN